MTLYQQLATVGGVGNVKPGPGTAGSAVALIAAIPILWLTGWIGMTVAAVLVTVLAIWAADGYGVETGIADPQDCVIDEVAGQWIACAIGSWAAMPGDPALSVGGFVLAFLMFRLFDIAKPWPVKKAENLRGGLGIVADDVVAGIIAGVVVFLFANAGFI